MHLVLVVCAGAALLPLTALPAGNASHALVGQLTWTDGAGPRTIAFAYDEVQPGSGMSKLRVGLGDGRIACLDKGISYASGSSNQAGYLSPAYAGCNPQLVVGTFGYSVQRTTTLGLPGVTVQFAMQYAEVGVYRIPWHSTGGHEWSLVEGETYVVVL